MLSLTAEGLNGLPFANELKVDSCFISSTLTILSCFQFEMCLETS